MKTNVSALRPKDITPRMVLEGVLEDVDNFESVYVVGFNKEGQPEMYQIYASGDLSGLSLATHLLQRLTNMYLDGLIDTERTYDKDGR